MTKNDEMYSKVVPKNNFDLFTTSDMKVFLLFFKNKLRLNYSTKNIIKYFSKKK
jgi:hypothetical protein